MRCVPEDQAFGRFRCRNNVHPAAGLHGMQGLARKAASKGEALARRLVPLQGCKQAFPLDIKGNTSINRCLNCAEHGTKTPTGWHKCQNLQCQKLYQEHHAIIMHLVLRGLHSAQSVGP